MRNHGPIRTILALGFLLIVAMWISGCTGDDYCPYTNSGISRVKDFEDCLKQSGCVVQAVDYAWLQSVKRACPERFR